jgi:hypothetical protein
MIKVTNIVQKSFDEQKGESKPEIRKRKLKPKSSVLGELFNNTEKPNSKNIEFSNKLGSLFGVEKP